MKIIISCITFLILCFLSFSQTVGTILNTNQSFNGYTLIAPYKGDKVYLIDNCGEIVHSWDNLVNEIRRVHLLDNGDILFHSAEHVVAGVTNMKGGLIKKYDWNGNLIWEYTIFGPTYLQHHDIEPLPNGNVLAVVYKLRSSIDALLKGKTTVGNLLSVERIIEYQPVGLNNANVVWEHDFWNHLVQDVNSALPNYVDIKNSLGKLDINYINTTTNDLQHVNAISYNPNSDLIAISSRTFNEVYIIDHSTTTAEAASDVGGNFGMGGQILWRWGNPEAYKRGTASDKILYGQHDVHWIADSLPYGGSLICFSNGKDRPGGNISTVEIIEPNFNLTADSTYLPIAPVTYNSIDINDVLYSSCCGGTQLLDNGNVLFSLSQVGKIVELTASGDKVWEYKNPVSTSGIQAQGQTHITNSPFWIAKRYPYNHPAIVNNSISLQGTIESGTSTNLCSIQVENDLCAGALRLDQNSYGFYAADNWIKSSTLSNNSIYEAGDEFVELNVGFIAQFGFEALIEDCDLDN